MPNGQVIDDDAFVAMGRRERSGRERDRFTRRSATLGDCISIGPIEMDQEGKLLFAAMMSVSATDLTAKEVVLPPDVAIGEPAEAYRREFISRLVGPEAAIIETQPTSTNRWGLAPAMLEDMAA
jgi:hypothetical protein